MSKSTAKAKKERWPTCNVMRAGTAERRLWQLKAKGDAFNLAREYTAIGSEKIPSAVVTKDFQTVWKPKLNVAWLPAGEVFLSVVELPTQDAAEIQGMLELQLEKLSPLPATQTVWSYVPLPRSGSALTRVLLVVAGRSAVETLLGKLEADGFLADRLELPQIDELLAVLDQGDGIWLFPRWEEGDFSVVSAWVIQGQLQHVGLTHLPAAGWQTVLQNQLAQVAWAGELDGWYPGGAQARIVAAAELAAEFEPVLREYSGQPVEVHQPLADTALAQLTARRTAVGQPVPMLPAEFSSRYRQLFVDRIWMRSLGAVVLLYLFGVLAYFGAIEWASYRRTEVKNQFRSIANTYTNTLQLRARMQILQNQMNLKYAALDSLRSLAEKLPVGVTVDSFNFQRGGKVTLVGSAPQNEPGKITDLVGALQNAQSDGKPLFASVGSPDVRLNPQTQTTRWQFDCLLANPEAER